MQIHPAAGELFHMYRWTDRYDEANSHFLQFHKRTEKSRKIEYKVFLL